MPKLLNGRQMSAVISMLFVMFALCNRAHHYIFTVWFLSIFFFSSPNLSSKRLEMHVWNVLHAAPWKYRTPKSPFWHHCTALSGCIFAAEACIDNRKNTSSTRPHNMVNFGLLTPNGWDLLASLEHHCKFQWLSRLGTVTAWHSSSGRQPNCGVEQRAPLVFGRATTTLGIGPHYSYGRPME